MYAVIHEIESSSTHGLIPIAGRPLVARQIQWLRSVRCRGIAVQIGSSAESVALGQWLARGDAIGTNVRLVMSGKILSPREIARRAGFPDNAPLIAIPADTLCGGAIEAIQVHARPEGALVALPAPAALAEIFDGSAVRILGTEVVPRSAVHEAWAIRVRSLAEAFVLGVAALDGRLMRRSDNGVLLHAFERERGVWISRGAHVDPSAKLIPPVLLGVDTIVRAGACVGPRAFLGDRSVIERGTRIENSLVAPGTIVGENLELSGVAIDSHGAQDLFTGEHATINETLVLAPRDKPHRSIWVGRVLAIVLFALMAPISLVIYAATRARRRQSIDKHQPAFRRLSALIQVIRGDRTLIGLSEWNDEQPAGISLGLYWKSLAAPLGLIKIDAGIAPEEADPATKLRSRVYYMHEKNFYWDFVLVFRCLGQLIRKRIRKSDKACQSHASQYMRALS